MWVLEIRRIGEGDSAGHKVLSLIPRIHTEERWAGTHAYNPSVGDKTESSRSLGFVVSQLSLPGKYQANEGPSLGKQSG